MNNFKKTIRERIAGGLLFGACTATIVGSGAVTATGVINRYISENKQKEEERDSFIDLPLMTTVFGEFFYNKTPNWDIVLTNQFEQEFFKGTTKRERDFAINGLKKAVSDFNDMTSFFSYSLTAETDRFACYGIEKTKNKNSSIYFTIDELKNDDEAGLSSIGILIDGEIVSAEISYSKDIVFGKFDERARDLYSASNSVFATVIEHELLHTLGFEDIFKVEQKNTTIMYYALNDNVRTYTKLDKKNVAKFERLIVNKYFHTNEDEIER